MGLGLFSAITAIAGGAQLILALAGIDHRRMWKRLGRETRAMQVPGRPPAVDVVTEAELAQLPQAVQRYLRFFRVTPGTRKDWSLRFAWRGRFRQALDRPWMPIKAVQYDLRAPVARVFHMKARMMGVFPILARDTYVDGHGHMLGKLAGVVTVADGRGSEFDEGELVTWLNDAVLFAPSMLLDPRTRWTAVNAATFDVAFTDGGRTVSARVTIDDRGAPIDFETTNRFLEDPADPKHPLVRGRWSTPMESWQLTGERPLPLRGKATWHLASGDFTYAEFELLPASVAFNISP